MPVCRWKGVFLVAYICITSLSLHLFVARFPALLTCVVAGYVAVQLAGMGPSTCAIFLSASYQQRSGGREALDRAAAAAAAVGRSSEVEH
jgi:hypothetical protein